MTNLEKYGIVNNKENRAALKIMQRKGQLPREVLLLAVSDNFRVSIHVYHGMDKPVVFRSKRSYGGEPVLYLQCLAGVHYNPVYTTQKAVSDVDTSNEKLVNTCRLDARVETFNRKSSFGSVASDEIIVPHTETLLCIHENEKIAACSVGPFNVCALIDTGAQISIVQERIVETLQRRGVEMILNEFPVSEALLAIDG